MLSAPSFAEGRPLSVLCELTYRCNLQCPYCYNPLALREYRDELSTDQWCAALRQAADLGVVQAHFSGVNPRYAPISRGSCNRRHARACTPT